MSNADQSKPDLQDAPKPVRCFQRYTSEQCANHAASFRLGYRQREATGEFFWIHPLVPGIAFPTRKAAMTAAARKLAA